MQTDNLIPYLSIDCVIFGFHNNELRVLLLRMKNMEAWALPGGFVDFNKDVDEAAKDVLHARTGLDNIFLQQFHVFGKVDRNEQRHVKELVERNVINPKLKNWFDQRFVTLGYYALVEYSKVKAPVPDYISEKIEWCPISDLPPLIIDHHQILQTAHERLKRELSFQPIGLNLLPKEFTMPELQSLYETILEKKLDRRNFRRKILSFDILKDTGKKRMGKAHKAPILYTFDQEKYTQALQKTDIF